MDGSLCNLVQVTNDTKTNWLECDSELDYSVIAIVIHKVTNSHRPQHKQVINEQQLA